MSAQWVIREDLGLTAHSAIVRAKIPLFTFLLQKLFRNTHLIVPGLKTPTKGLHWPQVPIP